MHPEVDQPILNTSLDVYYILAAHYLWLACILSSNCSHSSYLDSWRALSTFFTGVSGSNKASWLHAQFGKKFQSHMETLGHAPEISLKTYLFPNLGSVWGRETVRRLRWPFGSNHLEFGGRQLKRASVRILYNHSFLGVSAWIFEGVDSSGTSLGPWFVPALTNAEVE